MKFPRITISLFTLLIFVACSKEEVAEEPPITSLATGSWKIEQVQYTNEEPGYFNTATTMQVMGSVNFTFDSLYLSFVGVGMLADSAGNPIPFPLEDDRYGKFVVLDEDKFSIVDENEGQVIEFEGLARSENAMHLSYDIKSTRPVSLDSVVQIRETYILKLSR